MRNRLGLDPHRLAFKVGLARALTTFERNHPQWAVSFFDEHFLRNRAAPLLARHLTRDAPTDPTELAAAWADQLGLHDAARDRRIAEAMHPAADLLRWLDAELRGRPEFQALFDSRALDTIAGHAAQMAEAVERLQRELAEVLVAATKYQVTIQRAQGLVLGDNATVSNVFQTYFDHDYATLQEYYLPPDGVFDRVRLDDFVGRTWVERQLDHFLDTHDRGAWLLVGEAGIGKTTFLAHLVREHGYLHFFAEQAPGEANLPRALQSLAAQLISRFRLQPYAQRDT